MIRNHTLQRRLTDHELAERQAWFEENQREAAKVNAAAMLAGQQQREFDRQAALVEATMLSLPQLQAIRLWLAANP